MKESHVKGLAAHSGPESCGDARKGIVEALTGVRAGRVISRESHVAPGCRRCRRSRKATSVASTTQDKTEPRAVKDPEGRLRLPLHVRKHLAREPGDPMFTCGDGPSGRIGKSKDTRR